MNLLMTDEVMDLFKKGVSYGYAVACKSQNKDAISDLTADEILELGLQYGLTLRELEETRYVGRDIREDKKDSFRSPVVEKPAYLKDYGQ